MEQTQAINQAAFLELAFQAVRLYAETHPRPLHVTLGQAAEMLGIPMESLMKMMSGKKLRLNECGLIPIGDIDLVLASRGKLHAFKLQMPEKSAQQENQMPPRTPQRNSAEGTIIRLPQVEESVGLKKSAIYKLIKAGDFPSQIKLGKRASGWLESAVQTWIQKKAGR
jgi:prophage regulatory protein